MSKENNYIPAIIGMSQMAKLLHLSRSRLYQLIDAGILLPPAQLLSNKRPIYTKEMAMRNLEARTNNTGINGQIIMFYTARTTPNTVKKVNKKSPILVNKALGSKSGKMKMYCESILDCSNCRYFQFCNYFYFYKHYWRIQIGDKPIKIYMNHFYGTKFSKVVL